MSKDVAVVFTGSAETGFFTERVDYTVVADGSRASVKTSLDLGDRELEMVFEHGEQRIVVLQSLDKRRPTWVGECKRRGKRSRCFAWHKMVRGTEVYSSTGRSYVAPLFVSVGLAAYGRADRANTTSRIPGREAN